MIKAAGQCASGTLCLYRDASEGVAPAVRLRGANLLRVASQYWGLSVADAKRPKALKVENAKLKKLLSEAML